MFIRIWKVLEKLRMCRRFQWCDDSSTQWRERKGSGGVREGGERARTLSRPNDLLEAAAHQLQLISSLEGWCRDVVL